MPFDIAIEPDDDDFISNWPTQERTHRIDLKAMLAVEHDMPGEMRHTFGIGDDAARDAAIPPATEVDGNLWVNRIGGAGGTYMVEVFDSTQWRAAVTLPAQAMLGDLRTSVIPLIGATVRPWIPCDGRELSLTTFALLYAALGSPILDDEGFNESPLSGVCSDPVNLFRVPDFRGASTIGYWDSADTDPVGADPDGDYQAVGEFHGEKKVTLGVNEIPNHSHSYTRDQLGATATVNTPGSSTIVSAISTTTPATGSTGGGLAHENRHPVLTVGFSIYAGDTG